MAETIRDVVIRVALEQKESTLKVPGVEQVATSYNLIQKLITDIATNTKQIADTQGQFLEQQVAQNVELANTLQSTVTAIADTVAKQSAAIQPQPVAVKAVEEAYIEVNKAIEEATQSAVEMSATTTAVADTTTQAIQETKQEASSLQELLDEVRAERERLNETTSVNLDNQTSERVNENLDALQGHLVAIENQGHKVRQSMVSAGKGVLELARGVALTTGSTDNLKEWLERIAKLQGAYDIFEGGIKITKALTEVTQFAALASEAHAIAQELEDQAISSKLNTLNDATSQTATSVVVTTAQTVAASSDTKAQIQNAAAMGVNTTAKAGNIEVTIAHAGAVSADTVATTTNTTANIANAVSATASATAVAGMGRVWQYVGTTILKLTGPLGWIITIVSVATSLFALFGKTATANAKDAAEAVEELRKKQEALKQQTEALQRIEQAGTYKQRNVAIAAGLELESLRLNVGREMISDQEFLSIIDSVRAQTARDELAILREMTTELNSQNGLQTVFVNGYETILDTVIQTSQAMSLGTEGASQLAAILENQKQLRNSEISDLSERISLQERSLDKAREELDIIQNIANKEQQRADSINERVGRLDPGQLAELEFLSEQQAVGGKLNARQVARFEQLAGAAGGDFAKNFFTQQGKERGAENILAPFGVKPATQRSEQLTKLAQEARIDLDATEEAVRRNIEVLTTRQTQLGKEIAEVINKSLQNVNKGLEELKRNVEKGRISDKTQ